MTLAILLVAAACGGSDGGAGEDQSPDDSDTPMSSEKDGGSASGESITVAAVNPTTGGAAGFGVIANQGTQLAIEQINEMGGIECMGGAQFEMVTYDNQSKTEVASTAAERAVQDGADIMVSTVGSAFTLVQAQVAERNGIPFIADGAQALDLTTQGYEYVFRTVANANVVAQSDLGLISSLEADDGTKVETVAVMHEDSAYGTSYYDTIEKFAPDFDIEIVGEVAYPLDSPDLTDQAQRAGRMDADFIVVAGYPADTALGVRALYEQQIRPMGIHGATGAYHPDFVSQLGPISNYIFSEAQVSLDKVPGAEPGRADEVAQAYKDAYGEEFNAVAGQAYSTPWILKKALEKSCSADPDAVVEALRQIEVDGSDGSLLPYTVKFTENGEVENPTLVEYQYQDGENVTVWPDDVAVAEPIFPLPEDWGS